MAGRIKSGNKKILMVGECIRVCVCSLQGLLAERIEHRSEIAATAQLLKVLKEIISIQNSPPTGGDAHPNSKQ